MGNVEFSKVGRALVQNKELFHYVLKRLDNLSEQEIAEGRIEVQLNNGVLLSIPFGPEPTKASKLQVA